MLFGRCGCTEPIDDVGAQHLVFYLHLVLRQEEGLVAIEQGGGYGVGVGMKQSGNCERAEGVTTCS